MNSKRLTLTEKKTAQRRYRRTKPPASGQSAGEAGLDANHQLSERLIPGDQSSNSVQQNIKVKNWLDRALGRNVTSKSKLRC